VGLRTGKKRLQNLLLNICKASYEDPFNAGTGLLHLFFFKISLWIRIFISRIAFYYCIADLSWVDKRTGTHDVKNATHTRAASAHFRAKEQAKPLRRCEKC